MNERERQRRFAEKSTVRNSEYDKLNTNATRYANPVMRRNNLLPQEVPTSGSTQLLVLNVIAVIVAILLFVLLTVIARFILPASFYNGILFLAISLVISGGLAYALRFPLWRLWRNFRQRK